MTDQPSQAHPGPLVEQHLADLVWLAQDLQQRFKLDTVPEIVNVRLAQIGERLQRIKDVYEATKAKEEPPATGYPVVEEQASPPGDDSPGGGDYVPLSRPAAPPAAGRKSKGGAT